MQQQQAMKLEDSVVAVGAFKMPLKYFIYWLLACFLL